MYTSINEKKSHNNAGQSQQNPLNKVPELLDHSLSET